MNDRRMASTLPARHLSISINRSGEAVYEFASNPENLPQWVTGISRVTQVNGQWTADSPNGRVSIHFADTNRLGVLDHELTLASGMVLFAPMRVFRNHEGSEVIYSLYQTPGMSDGMLTVIAAEIMTGLERLKAALER